MPTPHYSSTKGLREFACSLSVKERKSFVNGFNLPSSVILDGDVFFHQMSTINPVYRSLDKLGMLKSLYDSRRTYGEAKKQVIQDAIKDVKSVKSYADFNRKAFEGRLKFSVGRKNTLYIKPHVGKSFISVDMINACFQAVKFADPSLVFGCQDYREFLSRYTKDEVFLSSKTIGHLLFSGLNCNLQQEIQFHIMCTIVDELEKEGIRNRHITQFTSDELVIMVDEHVSLEKVERALSAACIELGIDRQQAFRIEEFSLAAFTAEVVGTCYLKLNSEDEVTAMKGIDGKYMTEAVCFARGESPSEKDRMMDIDGRVAGFQSPISFEWI